MKYDLNVNVHLIPSNSQWEYFHIWKTNFIDEKKAQDDLRHQPCVDLNLQVYSIESCCDSYLLPISQFVPHTAHLIHTKPTHT